MNKISILPVGAALFLAACVSDQGTGATTHVTHSLNDTERAIVQTTLALKLNTTGVQLQSLKATEHLSSGARTVCGYVSGITPAGTRSNPAIFGGQFSTADSSIFVLFGGPGAGADAQRTATVKAICAANEINI